MMCKWLQLCGCVYVCIKFMTVYGGYQRGTLWPRHVSGSLKRRLRNWQKAVYKIDAGPKAHIQKGIHVCVCACVCVYIFMTNLPKCLKL